MSQKAKSDLASLLSEKAGLKQDIYAQTRDAFTVLSNEAERVVKLLHSQIASKDSRVRLIFSKKSDFEFQIHVGGDVLVFLMHTNIFKIEPTNSLWSTSYLKKDANRSFCGVINIYNYLHDSLFYNRLNDIGYLVGRLLINVENHYILQTEGKPLSFHNNFTESVFDSSNAKNIVEDLVHLVLNFDMYLPPFKNVAELTVDEMTLATQSQQFKTGKRLGFQFTIEED